LADGSVDAAGFTQEQVGPHRIREVGRARSDGVIHHSSNSPRFQTLIVRTAPIAASLINLRAIGMCGRKEQNGRVSLSPVSGCPPSAEIGCLRSTPHCLTCAAKRIRCSLRLEMSNSAHKVAISLLGPVVYRLDCAGWASVGNRSSRSELGKFGPDRSSDLGTAKK
jgi:hypothetical protein